jgi:DNA-binding response OmpR family regulator
MNRILVVEDDPSVLRGLADNLRSEGDEVLTAADGETALRLTRERRPDFLVLDSMLPKLSGYEVCRKVRDEGRATPILLLTARGEEADRVLGLDLGADDYVTKPFSVRELLARVRALLRRAQPARPLPDELRFDDVVIDFRRYKARKGGRALELTRKEFGVLRSLAARPGARSIRACPSPKDLFYFSGITWTPDGRELLLLKNSSKSSEPKTEIWRLSRAGGQPQPFALTAEWLRELRLHPDGKRVSFTAGAQKFEWWAMENFLPAPTGRRTSVSRR